MSVNENSTIFRCDKDNGNSYQVSTGTIYSFRGRDFENIVQNKLDEELEHLDNNNDSKNVIIDRINVFPKIVFLGTGSQASGPNRNCTAILIHIK